MNILFEYRSNEYRFNEIKYAVHNFVQVASFSSHEKEIKILCVRKETEVSCHKM